LLASLREIGFAQRRQERKERKRRADFASFSFSIPPASTQLPVLTPFPGTHLSRRGLMPQPERRLSRRTGHALQPRKIHGPATGPKSNPADPRVPRLVAAAQERRGPRPRQSGQAPREARGGPRPALGPAHPRSLAERAPVPDPARRDRRPRPPGAP